MKIKHYKLLALLGVGLITSSSSALSLLDANAALTAPASWTFKYTNEDFPGYKIRDSAGIISTPAYTRTADGAYYNYTNTSTITTGLEVTQTFNRSNTTWYTSGSSYIPNDTKIGSDSTVGIATNKFSFTFDNQTTKDYKLYFDRSSTSSNDRVIEYIVNTNSYGDFIIQTKLGFYYLSNSNFIELLIPAYSNAIIRSHQTGGVSQYFDAWYLEDLGVSAAYEAGVDDGYVIGQDDADLLVTGFSAMVGILVNFVLMIANLEVFGVSLMGILTIIILFAGIIWTLKLIRG
jgi:hypothetical protein